MTPQEKALQYIVDPGRFVARQPIDRSEMYITPDDSPEAIATLNDGDTSTDEQATAKAWERHNAKKHANAYKIFN